MKNIAIFASGSGTNAENIVRYFKNSELANVKLVLSDNPVAQVFERMQRLGVPTFAFTKEDLKSGIVLERLKNNNIDFIVLAGFLKLIPLEILSAYEDRVVNIHPALLPKFGGKGMYGMKVHEAVLAAHEMESGITIHFVNAEYDKGDILFQAKCPVMSCDRPETLANRVHNLEYQHYPAVIERIVSQL